MKGLQEVFTINGVPTFTFVEPKEYLDLLVALRTPGRGIVIEGPSGIGKTTAAIKAISQVYDVADILILSPRKKKDVEYIQNLPTSRPFGTIVIDDFHRLEDSIKEDIADLLKILADEGDSESKLIVLGINKAGENLISFGTDLNNRIEIITFGINSDDKIREVIEKGEKELNIAINIKDDIIAASNGSFYIAQMLSYYSCIEAKVTEEQKVFKQLEISFELVNSKVFEILKRKFHDRSISFVRGTKLRREGRAPYLQLLYSLSKTKDWILNINQFIIQNPNLKGSISQVVSKGYLSDILNSNEEFNEVLFLEQKSGLLIVQDPQYIYYLKSIPWSSFASEAGYLSMDFKSKYDFALSFAGSDRTIAEAFYNELLEKEFEVFYDLNEQYRILAEDVEDYLRPIYSSEATYVIVIIGKDYPKRIWTQFESESFKHRFQTGSVIPIVLSNVELSAFDITRKIGYQTVDITQPLNDQIIQICDNLIRKIADHRLLNA